MVNFVFILRASIVFYLFRSLCTIRIILAYNNRKCRIILVMLFLVG